MRDQVKLNGEIFLQYRITNAIAINLAIDGAVDKRQFWHLLMNVTKETLTFAIRNFLTQGSICGLMSPDATVPGDVAHSLFSKLGAPL